MSSPYLGLNLATAQTALSTTAASISAGSGVSGRRNISIKNIDAAISIYIGNTAAVTSATGYVLKAGEVLLLTAYAGAVFAVAASATPTVHTIEW